MGDEPRIAALLVAIIVAPLLLVPRAVAAQEMDFGMESGGEEPGDEEGELPPVEVGDPGGEEGEPEALPGEPVDSDEADGEYPSEAPPTYAFAVAAGDALAPAAAELGRTLRDLLAGSDQFSIEVADGRMNGLDFSASEALEQAAQLFDGGRVAYDNLEMDEAVERFEQALQAYEEQIAHLPDIGPISDCLLYMGAAQALSGRDRTARTTFGRVLAIDPERRPSADVFPPTVGEVFDYVAGRMSRAGSGSLSVTTTPTGADVYLDGTYQGPSPQSIEDVTAGIHYVRIRLPGHVEVGRSIEVRARREASTELSMDMTEDGPLVSELLAQLPGQLEERPDDAVGTVQRIGEILGIETLLTAIVVPGDGGVTVQYTAWDVLRGESLATATTDPIDSTDGVTIATEASASLDSLLAATWTAMHVEQAVDQPVLRPTPERPAPPPPRPPFWQEWWFWTVVGVVVVGAGLGIGFGAAAATGGPERTDGEVILDL